MADATLKWYKIMNSEIVTLQNHENNVMGRPSHLRSSIARELLQLSLTKFEELNLLSSLVLHEKSTCMFYTDV